MNSDICKNPAIVDESHRPGFPFRFLLAGLFVFFAGVFLGSSIWKLKYASSELQISIANGVIELNAQSFHIAPQAQRPLRARWFINRNRFPDLQFHLPIYRETLITNSTARINLTWLRIVLPLWLPLAILLGALAFLFIRRRLMRNPGICDRCDYDIRGNTSGRCPECGNPTNAGTSTTPPSSGGLRVMDSSGTPPQS